MHRYSDALLLVAETLNEQGKSADALPYVSQVRSRLPAPTAGSQTALRAAIAKEWRIELAFENHRWLDLLRKGQVIPVMTVYGAKVKAVDSGIPANAYQVSNEKLLFPIPFTELQRNTALAQNPGY
ncbi:hypothetical protein GCM10027347_06920 [Larkinella harenae]